MILWTLLRRILSVGRRTKSHRFELWFSPFAFLCPVPNGTFRARQAGIFEYRQYRLRRKQLGRDIDRRLKDRVYDLGGQIGTHLLVPGFLFGGPLFGRSGLISGDSLFYAFKYLFL